MEQQIAETELVVEGKILSSTSQWNTAHNFIYTVHEVQVYKIFNGKYSGVVSVVTPGGRVGDYRLHASESLDLRPGNVGVFFLKPFHKLSGKSQYEVVSDMQGFYRYDLIANTVSNPFESYDGITSDFYNVLRSHFGNTIVQAQFMDFSEAGQNFVQSAQKVAATISPTTISAGTESVVTLTGTGFGSTMGTVEFKWSDDGGNTYQPALASQIQSWTDTEIQVQVPSYAGTGTVRITDAQNNAQETAGILTITFAQSNGETFGIATQTSLIDQNNIGGYTWRMFTDFDADTSARPEFMAAFSNWRCNSNVNWRIGDVTNNDSSVVDGENVIRFDNGNELPMGVLGRCYTFTFTCNSPDEEAAIELDMVIDDGTAYHYGPGTPQPGEFDFQSIVLHELGHGHQLSHVIDSNDVMYYGLAPEVIRRTLGTNDIAGAQFVQTRCSNTGTCQFSATSNLDCTVSLDEVHSSSEINLYPSPVRDFLHIESSLGIEKIDVFDASGRWIQSIDNPSESVNLSSLEIGVYLLHIHLENHEVQNVRILKE
ncbi:MAG: hypothetical protein SchgKO_10710 [Schleiferiaceae bacterium]